MKVFDLAISVLHPYDKNAKKHPQRQIDLLAENIKRFGFTTPVLIDENNVVIAGHGRLEALKKLGEAQVPCVRIEGLSESEVKALRLADNKIAEMGEWDMDLVKEDLKELSADLQELTGFDHDLLIETDLWDDSVPENPPSIAKLGDLWLLGEHRVLCGDSTEKDDVERLMNGKKADMVFTDPPYNIAYKGHGKNTSNEIMGDDVMREAFDTFLDKVFSNYRDFAKAGSGMYVFHASRTQDQFMDALAKNNYEVKNQLIWNKPMSGLGWGDYRGKHEPFFYAGQKGASLQFYGDRTHSTVWDFQKSEQQLLNWAKRQKSLEAQGKTSVWSMKRDSVHEYVHPCLPTGELVLVNGLWQTIEKVKSGVKTNYGTVVEVTEHEAESVCEITLEDGTSTRATGNHPFLVKRGENVYWIEARYIQLTDHILSNCYDTDTLKPLCQEEKTDFLQLDQLQKKGTGESTTSESENQGCNTTSCGKMCMDQSRQNSKFTTKTKTSSIIQLRTSNLSTPLDISGITPVQENCQIEDGKSCARTAEHGKSSVETTGTTVEDGSQEKSVKNAGANEVSKYARFSLRKVGGVKIIQGKTKVHNLTIDGIPAFDTLIGVSHNTQKPVELITYALANSSKAEDIVLDLFLGSGSTLIAAEKTGRICYGMGLDPKYVDVIVKRYEDHTGKTAQKSA